MDAVFELRKDRDTFVRRDTFTVDHTADGVSIVAHLSLDGDETFAVVISNEGVVVCGYLHPSNRVITNVVNTRFITKEFVKPMAVRWRVTTHHTM